MQNSQLEVLLGCLECLNKGQKMTLVSVANDFWRNGSVEFKIHTVRGL